MKSVIKDYSNHQKLCNQKKTNYTGAFFVISWNIIIVVIFMTVIILIILMLNIIIIIPVTTPIIDVVIVVIVSLQLQNSIFRITHTCTCTRTHTYTHSQPSYGPLGFCPGLPASRHQKGKTRKIKPIWIYWSKRQWVAVASAGPYANLHLNSDK